LQNTYSCFHPGVAAAAPVTRRQFGNRLVSLLAQFDRPIRSLHADAFARSALDRGSAAESVESILRGDRQSALMVAHSQQHRRAERPSQKRKIRRISHRSMPRGVGGQRSTLEIKKRRLYSKPSQGVWLPSGCTGRKSCTRHPQGGKHRKPVAPTSASPRRRRLVGVSRDKLPVGNARAVAMAGGSVRRVARPR